MVAQKYRLTRPARPIDLPWTERPTAVVWVEASDHDTDGSLYIETEDEHLAEKIRSAISMSYGNRGRSLSVDEPFSPRDLACALSDSWMKQFEAVEISE